MLLFLKRLLTGFFSGISSATFNGIDDVAFYNHTINFTILTSFSFMFRTYAMNGDVLQIGNAMYYYKVRLTGAHLIVVYKLDDGVETTLTASVSSSNAEWYLANISEMDSTVTLTLFDSNNELVSNVNGSKMPTGENLNSIVRANENIQLGVSSYQGCLQQVRIQGILLPFYNDESFINNTSKERFILGNSKFEHGCQRGSGCNAQQCQHESTCIADYYTYTCNCSDQYAGRWCQNYANHCVMDACVYGICVNTPDSYRCQCYPGFTGAR